MACTVGGGNVRHINTHGPGNGDFTFNAGTYIRAGRHNSTGGASTLRASSFSMRAPPDANAYGISAAEAGQSGSRAACLGILNNTAEGKAVMNAAVIGVFEGV